MKQAEFQNCLQKLGSQDLELSIFEGDGFTDEQKLILIRRLHEKLGRLLAKLEIQAI